MIVFNDFEDVVFALISDKQSMQKAALEFILEMGTEEIRYHILLRKLMFGLEVEMLDYSIYILGDLTLHPDIFKEYVWSNEQLKKVRKYFVWNFLEIIYLLARVDDDGFNRGTFGQYIYWLIVGDDEWDYVKEVEKATIIAPLINRYDAAGSGLVLLLFWAKDQGKKRLNDMLRQQPLLKKADQYKSIVDFLDEYGEIIFN